MLAFLSSCSIFLVNDSMINKVDFKEINKIVANFKKDAKIYKYKGGIVAIPILFDKSKKKTRTLASCYYGIVNYIAINEHNWANLGRLKRKMVLYHELGHCILNRDHIEEEVKIPNKIDTYFDGCPKTIMTVFLSDFFCLLSHKNQYIAELFNGAK